MSAMEQWPAAAPLEARFVDAKDVATWLEVVLDRGEVVAPVLSPEGDEVFSAIDAPSQVLWTFQNPILPPKQVVLPQTDPVARFRRVDGHFDVSAEDPPPERVLLNVRSCDVSAFAFLREMYAGDLADDAFARRADALTLVSLACAEPCDLGFCVCCDAGPFLSSGFDLQLVRMDGGYYVDVGTEKGRALLDLAADLFRSASDAERSRRTRIERDAREGFGRETCHFGSAMRRISTQRVAEELWEAMSPWCLECGGCTHACPTCYCFSVADLQEDGCWTRCRLWDSCQYEAFTLEASGHNPRPRTADRMKRRFYHKVSAQYYARDGRVGCVGCGRCIRVCMGTTDMPEVVAAIRHGRWTGGRADE